MRFQESAVSAQQCLISQNTYFLIDIERLYFQKLRADLEVYLSLFPILIIMVVEMYGVFEAIVFQVSQLCRSSSYVYEIQRSSPVTIDPNSDLQSSLPIIKLVFGSVRLTFLCCFSIYLAMRSKVRMMPLIFKTPVPCKFFHPSFSSIRCKR